MSAPPGEFVALETSLREVVERSGFAVRDVLRLPHSVVEDEAVRVEFVGPHSSRVEVVRAYLVRPDTGWVATSRNYPVSLGGSGRILPLDRLSREAPSNEDYRRLLALDHVARTLPSPELHLDLPDAALEALTVAKGRGESTPSLVVAATTLLTALDAGAPLEWVLRRLEGVEA